FRPPLSQCRSWRYVNIDAATSPDFVASADSLPLPDSAADYVLLAETLEHLEFPEKALSEAARVLRRGGKICLTVPFLYPVHADPHDFQRWTPEKFRRELARLGFEAVDVRPMGGLFAVMLDSFESFCQQHYGTGRKLAIPFRVARKLLRSIFLPWLIRADAKLPFQENVTGGYFVTARKPQ
ncbi:MAG: class I SAM-dependent methyltransferase, partial [Bdellovibrionota bacterium]